MSIYTKVPLEKISFLWTVTPDHIGREGLCYASPILNHIARRITFRESFLKGKWLELSFSYKENTDSLAQSPRTDRTGIKPSSSSPFCGQHTNHLAEWAPWVHPTHALDELSEVEATARIDGTKIFSGLNTIYHVQDIHPKPIIPKTNTEPWKVIFCLSSYSFNFIQTRQRIIAIDVSLAKNNLFVFQFCVVTAFVYLHINY